jgi:hypothetical protein
MCNMRRHAASNSEVRARFHAAGAANVGAPIVLRVTIRV